MWSRIFMSLFSGKREVSVLEPWGQYNSVRGREPPWASNEHVSSCQKLRMLLFELITGRTSEHPRPNEYGWQEKALPAWAHHKTLFLDSRSSYFGYSHWPTSFLVSHRGAHICWNKVLWAHPGIRRFTRHRVSKVLGWYWWSSWIPPWLWYGRVSSEWITTAYTCWRGWAGLSSRSECQITRLHQLKWCYVEFGPLGPVGQFAYQKLEHWCSWLVLPCANVCGWDFIRAPISTYI